MPIVSRIIFEKHGGTGGGCSCRVNDESGEIEVKVGLKAIGVIRTNPKTSLEGNLWRWLGFYQIPGGLNACGARTPTRHGVIQ